MRVVRKIGGLAFLFWLSCWSNQAHSAACPPADRLLPEDTLVLVTAPDALALRRWFLATPQVRFWNDPALRPFRDRFLSKWKEAFLEPLQRELGVRLEDYTSLPQGQLTLALVPTEPHGEDSPSAAWLLLLDTQNKSNQLKTNLAGLRKRWIDANKPLRTERILNRDFWVVTPSSNDVSKTWTKYFPGRREVQELNPETDQPKAPPPADSLVIGQVDSLLIAGDSTREVEKVVIRLTGGPLPALADSALYQADRQSFVPQVPLYGWLNMKALAQLMIRSPAPNSEPSQSDPFSGVKPERVLSATGLAALKTVAFTLGHIPEGDLIQVHLGVAGAEQPGLLKILQGEPKDTTPPSFVPADTVKFQRWRIDGQRACTVIGQVMNDLSPGALNGVNLLIDTANEKARETDPGFDLRRNILSNLGDDLIIYEKAPRPNATPNSGPSLVLVGSPNPQELVGALKSLLVFMSVQDATTTEREFLGRKIFSIQTMPFQLLFSPPGRPLPPVMLNYAAGGNYLALSYDPSVLEEYLRNLQGQCKGLREVNGLPEAAQQVAGTGLCVFGYENESDSWRATLETFKRDPASATNSAAATPWSKVPIIGPASRAFTPLMDMSLLPPFESLAKYFSFSTYGAASTTDGVTVRLFLPASPQLRAAPSRN
jgi:hypothetical protein